MSCPPYLSLWQKYAKGTLYHLYHYLCMEVLSKLALQAQEHKYCPGNKISRDAPLVNPYILLMVLYFFTPVQLHQCQNMHQIIIEFCSALGKVINTAKSFLLTSPNAREEHGCIIHDIFNLKIVTSFGTYLGVAVTFEKFKACEYNFLVERVQRQLQGWKTKFLYWRVSYYL